MLLQGGDAFELSKGFWDVVKVFEGGGEDVIAGAFSVKLGLRLFQRRMRMSKEVYAEFIVRLLIFSYFLTHSHALSLGRVWRLISFVVPSSKFIFYGEYDKSNITVPEAAYHAMLGGLTACRARTVLGVP